MLVPPSKVPFCRNSTDVIVPSLSAPLACKVMLAGAEYTAPLAGAVRPTEGKILAPITVMGNDAVPLCPWLSVAVALMV